MKKNRHFTDKKKILLFIFMWLCWFLPQVRPDLLPYRSKAFKDGVLLVAVMVISVVCYYLISNKVIKTGVFFACVIGVAFALGIKLALVVCPMFFVIFIYKNSLAEKTKNIFENLSEILLFISPIVSIAGILFNFKSFISSQDLRFEPVFTGTVFIIIFAFLLKCCIDTKELTKGKKKRYQLVYITVIISVVASTVSFDSIVGGSISFFPYMLLISLMVLEEDAVMWRSADLLVDGIKKFAS